MTALLTTGTAVFVASQSGLVDSIDALLALIGVVAYAAWLDELVFRRLFPRALTRATTSPGARTTVVGIVASQALFAVSRLVPRLQQQHSLAWARLMRLSMGGALTAAVMARHRLAIATPFHAELNHRVVLANPPPRLFGDEITSTTVAELSGSRSGDREQHFDKVGREEG